jgi:hypothetical protein
VKTLKEQSDWQKISKAIVESLILSCYLDPIFTMAEPSKKLAFKRTKYIIDNLKNLKKEDRSLFDSVKKVYAMANKIIKKVDEEKFAEDQD